MSKSEGWAKLSRKVKDEQGCFREFKGKEMAAVCAIVLKLTKTDDKR
jgi:hypothetical protein